MSELLSSITGKSGVHNMIMPTMISEEADQVDIKDDLAGVQNSTSTSFYNALQHDHTGALYDVATVEVLSDTLEQEIIDTGTSKTGILTQVLSARMTAIGAVTIRVYIDSKPAVEFTQNLPIANDSVMCVGEFTSWGVGATSEGAGVVNTNGYGVVENNTTSMLTPLDSLANGLKFGMVFEDRLRVTIQGEFALMAGSASHKAAAAWLTYIPEGVL